jgi:hypothetical protein
MTEQPASDTGTPFSAGRAALWLFCALFFFFALTSSGRVRVIDEVMPLYQAESLVERGNTAVPQAVLANRFYGKFDGSGRPRAPYAPGQAAAAVPWYLAGRWGLARLPGVPAGARDVVHDFAAVLSSASYAALAAALAFLIFLRGGLAPQRALFATALFAFATPLWAYSAYFFSETLAAALLVGAAAVLFCRAPANEMRSGAAEDTRALLLGGLLLGLAVWVRPTHIIAAPVYLAALATGGAIRSGPPGARSETSRVFNWRGALMAGGVVGVCVAAMLARNAWIFGSAFEFGYPEAAEGGKRLNTFETPLLVGLFGFLFSPGKAVLLFAPGGVVALGGLRRLREENPRLAMVAAGVPLVYLLFFAKYTQWEGGYCFGPRYLVPAIAVLCLATGAGLARAASRAKAETAQAAQPATVQSAEQTLHSGHRGTENTPRQEEREEKRTEKQIPGWVVAILLAGITVNAIGMATSFLEDQAAGGYYDARWNYQLSHSPLTRQFALLLDHAAGVLPAPLGLGYDRWFVFLSKAGVANITLVTIAALLFAEMCLSVFWLKCELENRRAAGG